MRAKHFDREHIVNDFIAFAAKRLNLQTIPDIKLVNSPEFSRDKKTFGFYEPEHDHSVININERNLVDVLRTIAHELTHAAQDQGTVSSTHDTQLPGKEIENVANAMAGSIVRDFTKTHGNYFGMRAEE